LPRFVAGLFFLFHRLTFSSKPPTNNAPQEDEMTQLFIRTEYSGVSNKKSDVKKSQKIAKKFNAKVIFVADKGAQLEIEDEFGFRRAMQEAGIAYLIDRAF